MEGKLFLFMLADYLAILEEKEKALEELEAQNIELKKAVDNLKQVQNIEDLEKTSIKSKHIEQTNTLT